MKYPQYAIVKNQKYEINTDYHVALDCFEIINDDSIGDIERTYAIVYKLFGIIPHDDEMQDFVRIVTDYLGCGEKQSEHQQRKVDMDFQQDWKYIVASFMSDYHIDMNESQMHWYQFIHLIQGLTEHSIMSRIREVRNYDLNEIKDLKTRRKIMEAQKNVELHQQLTHDEDKTLDEFEALFI